jgi:hypothetical protein
MKKNTEPHVGQIWVDVFTVVNSHPAKYEVEAVVTPASDPDAAVITLKDETGKTWNMPKKHLWQYYMPEKDLAN